MPPTPDPKHKDAKDQPPTPDPKPEAEKPGKTATVPLSNKETVELEAGLAARVKKVLKGRTIFTDGLIDPRTGHLSGYRQYEKEFVFVSYPDGTKYRVPVSAE